MKRIKPRIFIDLDGVCADFNRAIAETGMQPDEFKRVPGAYLNLQLVPGAIDAVNGLVASGNYEVFFATKPPTGVPDAYADKVRWVMKHFYDLRKRIIITPDKGLLGGENDILIDDRPGTANCFEFTGRLIHFVGWPQAIKEIEAHYV